MKMDFILNGQGHGDVANRLLACNGDLGSLRPWIGKDGKAYMTLNRDGKLVNVPISNATATLRKDDWILLDDVIIKAAKQRLKAVQDLISGGLTFNIPNGMAYSVLQTETQGDINDASVSMDGMRENANDRPTFEINNLPLPIIHKDFSYSARNLLISRNGGSPLDTTTASLAARKVAEEAEKMLIGVSTTADQYNFGGGVIYGYTDFPNRLTKTITSPTASGWTGSTLLAEVLAMMTQARGAYHYGPYVLYTGTGWEEYLGGDFKTNSDKSLRSRLLEIEGLSDIRALDYLTGYTMVLVQMTSDVVREVMGMSITTVQWDTHGGMQKNFKVMAIMVPQIRADQNDNCGIVHATV